MPQLTTAALRKYRAQAERREIRDSLAPGLRLVIQPSGAKSWAMRFRRPDGRPAKLTLGVVDLSEIETPDEPVVGAGLTLRQARQLAHAIDRKRARGIDVVEEYKASKLRAQAELATRGQNTFGATVIQFFQERRTRWGLPRRWRGDSRTLGLRWPRGCTDPAQADPQIIKGSLADTWSDRPISSIDGNDIRVVIDQARRHGVPGLRRRNLGLSDARGRKLFDLLSLFFNWALQQCKVLSNPAVKVWRPSPSASRTRVLSATEIVALWRATEEANPFNAIVRLLLLTGCRRNEVALLRWEEISEDGATLNVPASRCKNHRPHSVALAPLARDIIAKMPKIEGSPFVFSRSGAFGGWSKLKLRLDAEMALSEPWRVHDLRRTFVTHLAEMGVRPDVIELTVNHVSGSRSGVAGVYNRSELMPERRAALERWSAHVAGLVNGDAAKVIPLRGEQR